MNDLSRRLVRFAALGAAVLGASSAHASFLSGDALDTAADWLAIIVLCVVPLGAIVVFWLVHVLPEKIAEKRHHPHTEAITTLCQLSLVFGGMLWPIAWLWAYTRPIGYKAAYGTDKHDDYFVEMEHKARSGQLLPEELRGLRVELDAMEAQGRLPAKLKDLKDELDRLPAEALAGPAVAGERGRGRA